ncbi:MAG: hypothetical protein U0361_23590 [Nitrospiraceae bacterium]
MQVFNPMLEVAYVTLLGRRGGCLIHASGSVIDGCGYLFSSHSGAGKSTLAAMFADQGAVVLSDERLVLTRETDGYLMHGTPWVGSGQYAANAAGPLTALYTIATVATVTGSTTPAEACCCRSCCSRLSCRSGIVRRWAGRWRSLKPVSAKRLTGA